MGRPLLRDDVPIGQCKVRALYSWSGDTPQDLGFVEGDIIEVLNTGDGDWWTGKLQRNKTVGLFPRNFAEYCNRNQETMSSSKSPKLQKLSNYAYVSDPTEHTAVTLTDLQIPEPKSSLSSSQSAQDFLNDVSQQLNGKFLNDIDLDAHPEELRTPELANKEFTEPLRPKSNSIPLSHLDTSKFDISELTVDTTTSAHTGTPSGSPSGSPSDSRTDTHTGTPSEATPGTPGTPVGAVDTPPVPPPHTVSLNSSRSSRHSARLQELRSSLSQSQSRHSSSSSKSSRQGSYSLRASSIISETDKTNQSSALTGPVLRRNAPAPQGTPQGTPHGTPHSTSVQGTSVQNAPQSDAHDTFRKSSEISRLTMPVSPVLDQEVPFSSNTLSVRKMRSKAAQQDDSDYVERPSFLEKLFPKNSQTSLLRRTFSKSSHKSSKSVKSSKSSKSSKSVKSVTTKLKNFKNLFSNKHQTTDTDLFPANPSKSSFEAVSPIIPKNETAGFGSAKFDAEPLGGKWVQTRRDLYRARSLTSRDVQKRRKELALQGINDRDLVSFLNEQCRADLTDYRLMEYMEVDHAVMSMSTWPQLMTPAVFASSRIGRHFSNPLDRVRAVFLLCATRIAHVGHTESLNVMQSRQANKQQLAQVVQDMLTSLDVESLVIPGHIRQFKDQCITSTEHYWNAVRVNNEWRFIDSWMASENIEYLHASAHDSAHDSAHGASTADDTNVDLFYFMTPPAQLVYSHIPLSEKHQFLTQSVPTSIAALLPLASPSAFAHKVLFTDFWLGRTRISDLEVCELLLTAPFPDMDIAAFICGQKALAQPTYINNQRIFKVKAFLPPKIKHGVLEIFAINKTSNQRKMEKLWDVEIRLVSGSDKNAPYEFVTRFPLATSDLYILEPQCKSLGGGDTYTFKIENFPTEQFPQQPQIAVQSPSGRLTRLIPQGTDAQDTFKTVLKTLEVGTWRGVTKTEKTWTPFCEWFVA